MNRILIAVIAASCAGSKHEAPDAEPRTESFTQWTDAHELFVEYAPLVVGSSTRFAVHSTRIAKHAAVTSGSVVVTLRMSGGGIVETVASAPARTGIFAPTLVPTTAGPCTLVMKLDDATAKSEVTVPCVVYASAAQVPKPEEDPPGRIAYLKESAWTTDLEIQPAGEHDLVPTLRTTGEIRAMAGREARLTATAHGRVVIDSPVPVLGTHVEAGQVLARIVPQVEGAGDRVSLAADDRTSRIELEAAEAQLARAERLWAEKTIPEKQLEEAKTRVALSRSRVDAAKGRLGQFDAGASGRGGGRAMFQVRSPLAGTLVAINVTSGQSVEDGELLFMVVDLGRVWLHADVFEPDVAAVANAQRASFRVDGIENPIRIEPPDGRVVTIGQLVDEKTRTVPMIFELSNTDQKLRIGSFATVWIETGESRKALAIPDTAIVDDAGRKVAYVQVEGESFERRVLTLGIRSGGWVEVKQGVAASEHVVTRGAYEIKLAASGGAIPEHGHQH